MTQRDRAAGWQHAKRSGHTNEDKIAALLNGDPQAQKEFLQRIGHPEATILRASVGGLHEKNVPSIYPGTTKCKTDLQVELRDGMLCNVSIKKSLGGQVFLIGVDRFIHGFQSHYGQKIPQNVQRAMSLFWGTDDNVPKILAGCAPGANRVYEQRKHRLVAETLRGYDPVLYQDLLAWFQQNAHKIADFCFSKGLASSPENWAEWIWYKNLLAEHQEDALFHIEDFCSTLQNFSTEETFYGPKTGGSTIQLPFGFVQWHQDKMQFHHSYDKIAALLAQ